MRLALERHAALMRARGEKLPVDPVARGIRRARLHSTRRAAEPHVQALSPELAALYATEPCFACHARTACMHRNLREDLAMLDALRAEER
ncbi:MAG TPA: hypothetical protein VHA14_14655 [Bryobacteraceae bacterium]|jgi:hypothetical protein|nr:hypothetical protein [Bryobacteraceae bacterium]